MSFYFPFLLRNCQKLVNFINCFWVIKYYSIYLIHSLFNKCFHWFLDDIDNFQCQRWQYRSLSRIWCGDTSDYDRQSFARIVVNSIWNVRNLSSILSVLLTLLPSLHVYFMLQIAFIRTLSNLFKNFKGFYFSDLLSIFSPKKINRKII